MRIATVLAWAGVSVGTVLILGLAVHALQGSYTRSKKPSADPKTAVQTQTPVRPGVPKPNPRLEAWKAGPDTSGFRGTQKGTVFSSAAKAAELVGDDGKDDLMDSYDRVGAAVQAFPDVPPQAIVQAAGQPNAGGNGCSMQWEQGSPSLMFGKNASLNQSLTDCEKAISHIQVQKVVEKKEEDPGWRRFFGGWGK